MAAQNVGSWYNGTVGKALGQTGVGGFVNGFLTGAGETVSGMAQFSVYDTGKSLVTLATNGQARAQFAEGVGSWWHQLSSGNVFVAGQTTAVVASLFVGGESATVAKADEATSLVSKLGDLKTFVSIKGSSLVDDLSGKMADFRSLVNGNGLNYAFAGAGDGRSVLSMANKTMDDLPKTDVRMGFSRVTGESSDVEKAQKALQDALDSAPKNPLSDDAKDLISSMPKGERPAPDSYLPKEYIEAHNQQFEDGAIKVQKFSPSDDFNGGAIGNPKDKVAFVMPKDIGQKVIDASGGDPRKLEELLGLHSGDLGDNPAIINIDHPQNIQIPSGNESSAFDGYWKAGGYTHPGNIPEAVVNEVPKGEYTWHSLN